MSWLYLPNWLYILTYTVIFISTVSGSTDDVVTAESNLRKELFSGYDKMILPKPANESLHVNISLTLIKLEKVDLAHGQITSLLSFDLEWINAQLSWKTKPKYTDVERILALSSSVWTPLIFLNNDLSQIHTPSSERLEIKKDGNCRWKFTKKVSVSCSFDTFSFPRDKHECAYQFAPAYQTSMLKLNIKETSLLDNKGGNEWKIPTTSREIKLESAVAVFHFKVSIERGSVHIVLHLLLPLVVSTSLVLLTFTVVTERPTERLLYILFTVLFTVLFGDSASEVFPESDSGNLLLGTIEANHFIIWLYLLYCCLSLWLASKNPAFFPRCVQAVLFQALGKVFLVSSRSPSVNNNIEGYIERELNSVDADIYDFKTTPSGQDIPKPVQIDKRLQKKAEILKKIKEKSKANSDQMPLPVAKILDRLGIAIFVLLYFSAVAIPAIIHFTK